MESSGESSRRAVDLGDDRLAGTARDLEHVPVIRPIDAPVDDDGKLHLLGLVRLVVGFLVETLRQRVQSERHGVGDETFLVGRRPGELPARRLWVAASSFGLLEIPAVHLDRRPARPRGHPRERCSSRTAARRS